MRNEPNIIIHWYDIGLELLDNDSGTLNLIKQESPGNLKECCTKMFDIWLARTPDASWNQLIGTLEKIQLNTAAKKIKIYSMLIIQY